MVAERTKRTRWSGAELWTNIYNSFKKLQALNFSVTSCPIGNHYCEIDLYTRYWHLHVVNTNRIPKEREPPTPFEGNNKSDSTSRTITTFKN
eukprot:1874236-Amphidinium_carterae.1